MPGANRPPIPSVSPCLRLLRVKRRRPRGSSPRKARKPAPSDAEGDWKFSLRTSIGPTPEIHVKREDDQYRIRRSIFQTAFCVPRSGFPRIPWSATPRRPSPKSVTSIDPSTDSVKYQSRAHAEIMI